MTTLQKILFWSAIAIGFWAIASPAKADCARELMQAHADLASAARMLVSADSDTRRFGRHLRDAALERQSAAERYCDVEDDASVEPFADDYTPTKW